MKKYRNAFFKNQYFVVFSLLVLITLLYYLKNIYNLFNIKILSFSLILSFIFVFLYLYYKNKLNKKMIIFFIISLGLILRINYSLANSIFSRQHDVGQAFEDGHYGYALFIFRNWNLPDINTNQLYQPPLNAILQAIWMKINSIFISIDNNLNDIYLNIFNNQFSFEYNNDLIIYLDSLYSTCRILSCFYSCLTLLVINKILNEFNLSNRTYFLILLLIATQPVLIMFSGSMNNDNLSYLFFFCSLLFAIKWFKKPCYLYIALIGLCIGLGMLCKLSVGFIAFIIGPMMIIKLIEYFKKKDYSLLVQLIIFSLIVFPLGLSYAFRNYFLFNQSFTYILDFGRDSWLHAVIKEKSIYERFLSLPFSQLFHFERGIYHDYQEYNIWVDLIKTSIFGEFSYDNSIFGIGFILYILNIGYWLFLIPCFIFIFRKIKNKTYQGDMSLTILSIGLIILAFISYISLCIKMPYSCSSNFRYITYISLAISNLYCLSLENLKYKKLKIVFTNLLVFYSFFSVLFILFIF